MAAIISTVNAMPGGLVTGGLHIAKYLSTA